ncbi:MAG TPA: hypothetical protein VM425_11035 [Myxococcota bacterium]|nr:hypothetical protein [Myxococcota bacterium]
MTGSLERTGEKMREYKILSGLCVLLSFGCLHCSGGQETNCIGCLIDDICFPPGVTNPLNPCQVCEFLASKTSWSDDDGAGCIDGVFCNGADTCSGGACSEHAGSPCGNGLICNESMHECALSCEGCLIQGVCLFDGQSNPLNPCQVCSLALSATSWSDNDGADCDDGTYCDGVDTCSGHDCTSSGNPCDASETCWEDAGGRCCSQGGTFMCNASGNSAEYDSCGHELSEVMICGFQCQDGDCLCNPVSGSGCPSGYKCTFADDRTGCFPDGDLALGQACTSPQTGTDECTAGSFCLDDVCTQICTTSPSSCASGYVCSVFPDLFGDQASVGLCVDICDPTAQSCADPAEACYLQAITGESSCAGVPSGSVGKLQGDPCYGPATGGCYLNGCDKGYGANLPDDTCAFFCNPIDNWMGHVQGLSGDPAGITCASTFGGARPDGPGPAYECLYIQSFYSNTDNVPATIGMCVDPVSYGSCADFDWAQLQADIADGTADSATYCDDFPNRCLTHCISLSTFESAGK